LLLCGATAIAGFGFLGLSSNAGMASLGQVCAVGIAGNMLISVFLLPVWWKSIRGRELNAAAGDSSAPDTRHSSLSAPSSLYRTEFWLLGLWLVRILPRG